MWVTRKAFGFSLAIGLVVVPFIAPASAWSAELQEIQRRGKLVVAVKDTLRPLGFRDAAGNLQGLEIDIAKRLAEELLGKPDAVVLQPVKNTDRLNVVLNGKVDLTIARVTANQSRLRVVDLSRPYYLDSTGLVTKETSITKLSNLATKTIAVLKGSSTIAVVKYATPTSKLVGVDSYEQARSLLENGGADAFAADKSVLAGWVQEYPQYKMLPDQLSAEALCIVMPKGLQYTKLQERVNEAIARWQASGWLAERAAAWGLP
ncbi:MAG: transporter substrate-binding domain-containing protein [Coleofasciculus sp. Co-bin14]|nr:transporter substrate-binding domain-containing protein [Coleofasciculus sp. Co-bin14]